MNYKLQDLIDIGQFQLLQDRLNEIYSFPSAIIDNDGNILTATGWQDICTKFHRANRESEAECIKSDQYILSHLHETAPAVSYRCPHGLIDNAAPIIIEGVHYGNFFTGQFFFEKPDAAFFKEQAKNYGFDETAYLAAVQKVPVWTQQQLNNYLFFIRTLIEVISGIGLKNLREIETQKQAGKNEKMLAGILNSVPQSIFWKDLNSVYLGCNETFAKAVALGSPEQIIGKTDYDLPWQRMEADAYRADDQEVMKRNQAKRHIIEPLLQADGSRLWIDTTKVPLTDESGTPCGVLGVYDDITERRKAEEAKDRLLNAVSVATEGIAITDDKDRFTYVNDAHARIYGCLPDELIGKTWRDTVTPELVPLIERDLSGTLHNRAVGIWSGMSSAVRKDGTIVPTEITATSRWDESGNYLGHICIVRDISERKRAEEALRESEAQFMELFRNAADAIFIADIDSGVIVEANLAASRLMLLPRSGIVGLHHTRLHPPQTDKYSKETFEDQKRQIEQKLPTHPVENNVLRSDGVEVPIEVLAAMVTIKGKKCIMGTFRDITERKRAEEKLRQSEEFIRSILNTVDEGFIVIDPDYRILSANRAYCSQVGCSDEGIVGRHCYEVSHRISRPCYEEGEECAVRRVFATGEPHSALHRHKDPHNHMLYVETKAYPIRDDYGNVTSVIETINNITEKHLLEEERLKTQKLESIGTLAGGIAHDFNNLLQGIFGYISMAKISPDCPDRIKAMLQQAEEALHLTVNLTTQLLTFSKGGKPIKKLIRLEPVIENAVKFALSGSHTGHLLDIAPDLWPVEADEGQLAQVIQNIVLNANEAMARRGTVSIFVGNAEIPKETLHGLRDGGRFVRIAIQDCGTGISEQNREKIFDPYFTTKQKGSGLGLATSYSIIRNHGGIIDVKSTMGAGSTFTIYLPAPKRDAIADKKGTAAAPLSRKGRILIVDDEELVRNVAREMIVALGHEAEIAAEGDQAIQMFLHARESGSPFDLVILDLTIKGGMGGEGTIKKLRMVDPHVVAVVSSGYADNPVVADFQAYGFSASLNKPYRIDALKDCINTLLRVSK